MSDLLANPGLEASWQAFTNWQQGSDGLTLVRNTYIDMAGDLPAGVMLSRVIYWHSPSKEGKRRLKVKKNDKYWLVKGYSDWHSECRISKDQAKRAIKVLVAKGLIETEVHLFSGAPTMHIRILPEGFLKAWETAVSSGTDMEKRETHFSKSSDIEHPIEQPQEQGETHYSDQRETPHSDQGETCSTITETTGREDLSENTFLLVRADISDIASLALDGIEEKTPALEAEEGDKRKGAALLDPAFAEELARVRRKRLEKEAATEQRRKRQFSSAGEASRNMAKLGDLVKELPGVK